LDDYSLALDFEPKVEEKKKKLADCVINVIIITILIILIVSRGGVNVGTFPFFDTFCKQPPITDGWHFQ